MYSMEKSSRKAAMTNAAAANATAAKTATPARRAVSPSRSPAGPLIVSASMPKTNEYAARPRAITSAKLPTCDMGILIFSETRDSSKCPEGQISRFYEYYPQDERTKIRTPAGLSCGKRSFYSDGQTHSPATVVIVSNLAPIRFLVFD